VRGDAYEPSGRWGGLYSADVETLGLESLILFVSDLELSRAFYVNALGLPVVFEDDIIVVVGGPTGRLVMHRNDRGHDDRGTFPAGNGVGGAALRFRVDDPDECERQAAETGLPVLWPTQNASWGRFVVLADPDGRSVVLARMNRPATTADAPHDWDGSYVGPPPPWDIGRPQPAFVRLAEAGALAGVLLDAGCGTGEHTILAARHGARALGIDVSPLAVDIARRKAIERGVDTSFQVLDVLRLVTLGEAFDTVVDSGLFHVFDDSARARYVTALRAVLRPGGHLHLMCFSDRQPGDWGPRRVTEGELRAAFGFGWRIGSLAPDHFDINPGLGSLVAEAWLADIVRLAPE
jgi:SAM-dependent methyltransferase/predicted enzyme related to lactoylglutathione lyase